MLSDYAQWQHIQFGKWDISTLTTKARRTLELSFPGIGPASAPAGDVKSGAVCLVLLALVN